MHEVGTRSVEGRCLGMHIVRDGGGCARSECADRTSGGSTSHVGVDQNDDGGGAASLIEADSSNKRPILHDAGK